MTNTTNTIKRLWARVTPIIGIIIFIVLFIFSLFMFSYLLIIGTIIGLGLFIYAFIRSKLTHHKPMNKYESQGRIIDHEPTQEEKNFPHKDKSD